MFWGLQMEKNLRYSQQVPEGFRITKATLLVETPSRSDKVVQVFVEQDGTEYAIATLKHGSIFDCALDLRFAEGEDICFYMKGEGVVFLTGHSLYPDDDPENDASYVFNSDEESCSEEGSEDSESNESDSIEDITEHPELAKKGKLNGTLANGKSSLKAIKGPEKAGAIQIDDEDDDDDDEDDDDEDDDADEDDADESGAEDENGEIDLGEDSSEDDDDDDEEIEEETLPGKKRASSNNITSKTPDAKRGKLQRNGISTPKPEPKSEQKKTKTPQETNKTPGLKNLKNEDVKELKIENLRPGNGPVAKPGKNVHVYYTGTLLNGKKFDQTISGKPFSFKLGCGQVIKGWDKGLEGMKVGGKRRLVIPAKMAYGKQATGPIPANSALLFDIELKAVN